MKYEIKRGKVESIKLDLGDVVVTLNENNILNFTYNRTLLPFNVGDVAVELMNNVVVKFYISEDDQGLLEAVGELFMQKRLK